MGRGNRFLPRSTRSAFRLLPARARKVNCGTSAAKGRISFSPGSWKSISVSKAAASYRRESCSNDSSLGLLPPPHHSHLRRGEREEDKRGNPGESAAESR